MERPPYRPGFGEGQERARILLVDDEESIHEDYRRCLNPPHRAAGKLDALRSELFAVSNAPPVRRPSFALTHATSGEVAARRVAVDFAAGAYFALAFVDMRMSPWNGVETISALWDIDPRIQTVLCTAYSDFTWDRVLDGVGHRGNLHLLRKPFAPDHVQRFAEVLCKKWQLAMRSERPRALGE